MTALHQGHRVLRRENNERPSQSEAAGPLKALRLATPTDEERAGSDGVYLLRPRGNADKRHSSHHGETTRCKGAEVGTLGGAEGRRRHSRLYLF